MIVSKTSLTENQLIECGDSTKNDCNQKDDEVTPNSKVVGKRLMDSVDSTTFETEAGEGSTNKPLKLKCIKTEKD